MEHTVRKKHNGTSMDVRREREHRPDGSWTLRAVYAEGRIGAAQVSVRGGAAGVCVDGAAGRSAGGRAELRLWIIARVCAAGAADGGRGRDHCAAVRADLLS